MRSLAIQALTLAAVADASLAARRPVRLGSAHAGSTVRMTLTRTRTHTAFLSDLNDPALASTLAAVFDAVGELVDKIKTASCDSHSCFNTLGGEEQLAIDLVAYSVMHEKLVASGAVQTISSTEEPYEIPVGDTGAFAVAFDALDSCSSVEVNFAVGASFGVWRGGRLTGVRGRDMAAAGLAMYGPRTSLLIATAATPGVVEFVLAADAETGRAEWRQANGFTVMSEDQPYRRAIFAPGNLRATAANAGYRRYVDSCIDKCYHLRYSGGMVPDVAQLLIKGCGIFTNPDGGVVAPARLRLLYEAIPAAFLVEKLAGGASSDGARSLLDVVVEDTDQRVQVALGCVADVARFDEMVGYAPPSRS